MNKERAGGKKECAGRKHLAMLPPIGKYSSRKEWEAACWRRVRESKELLELLVTSHERRDLVMRAAALEGITSGKSYRQISKELWLSLQTISGIKKALKENSYRSYLERSKKERKKRKYSDDSGGARPRSADTEDGQGEPSTEQFTSPVTELLNIPIPGTFGLGGKQ